MNRRQKKKLEKQERLAIKDFFDRILPGNLKFYPDHYVCGDSYRCVWAVREYPPSTEEQAILSQLADRSHITLRIYNRLVDSAEQRKIIQNATRRNRLRSGGDDMQETVDAENNLKDVVQLLADLRKNREPLLHTAVFLELKATDLERLRELQTEVMMELTRAKINVDKLTLRQLDGFLSVTPFGNNRFGSLYERVLPASSVANLYPFNYSGKTDPHGFYLGRDKFGTNILTDFDRRSEDKTNANILILGNSGQGKSYLLKGLLSNLRESGKSIIVLDPEGEYQELCYTLGGCYLDYLSGKYVINPLQPLIWNEETENEDDERTPEAFKKTTMLSRHISYLKDFFRSYKDFSTPQLDTIELMLQKLYRRFDMDDYTDFSQVAADKFPTMSDFYDLLEEEYDLYDAKKKNLFSEETIQEVCLELHSMCKGAELKYFNGHTNIKDDRFLVFGVKGIMELNRNLRDALLFSILSYMTNALLGAGNYVGALDELYLFLTNLTAIEYIRNLMKRDRKKESLLVLASQNLEDFLQPGVRELTKPLFSIPTHQFLFNPGQLEPKSFCDTLQLEDAEFQLIRYPERGTCLYRCGNERYLLQVHFPQFKEAMFGKAGGR
jgi:type IV secretory pathway VirB4 component